MKKLSVSEAKPRILGVESVIETTLSQGVYGFGKEGRPDDGLLYVLAGEAHYAFADPALNMDVHPGDLFYLGRRMAYACRVFRREFRLLIINFRFETPEDCCFLSMLLPAGALRNRETQFRDLLSVRQMKHPACEQESLSLLYRIYAGWINAAAEAALPPASKRRMEEALRYMHEHVGEETMTAAKLAAALHLSEAQLRRNFSAAFGISPMRYLQTIRIEQAKERLSYSNDSVTSIAESLGYSGVYHFSHAFRKETGSLPSEYRALHRMTAY